MTSQVSQELNPSLSKGGVRERKVAGGYHWPVTVHPFCLAIFPILALYVRNPEQLSFPELLITCAEMLALAALVWGCAFLFVRDAYKSSLVASVGIILFVSYGHALTVLWTSMYWAGASTDILNLVQGHLGRSILLGLWITIFTGAAFLLLRTRLSSKAISTFLDAFAIALFGIVVANWLFVTIRDADANRAVNAWHNAMQQRDNTAKPVATAKLPNVYYIILDGYGREDILRSIYGVDNSTFIDYLRQKGFYVADKSRSNYNMTALSISSSLNSIYIDSFTELPSKQSTNWEPLAAMAQDNAMVWAARRAGYKFVAFSNEYAITDMRTADQYMAPRFSVNSFQNGLVSSTPLSLVLDIPFLRSQYDFHRERINYTLDHLADRFSDASPVFVFAHILAPHPPFVFGADGLSVNPDQRFDISDGSQFMQFGTGAEYRMGYGSQVKYITARITDVVDLILAHANGPTIVILQGDHGPGSQLDWLSADNTNLEERMSILNAVYFPDREYGSLYPDITPVNTFRVVRRQYLGEQLELLPDRSFFAPLDHPYNFVDVTARLAGAGSRDPSGQ